MNKPESLHNFVALQGAVHEFLWIVGRSMTVVEIQAGFAGESGDAIKAACDALVFAGDFERHHERSPIHGLWEVVVHYRATTPPKGGRDDA